MVLNAGPPMDLPKQYDPQATEPRLYAHWERSGYFHEDPDPARPPFIICMPPPNVTARAHLGHGSTYAPMDVLTRYHRMLGNNADWLPGIDHAAIATEAVLVRELTKEGLRREDLGREAFVERAWEWSRTYGGQIFEQFRRLGFGPDWQRSRFTMDDALSAAVRRVFVTLYRDGLIYRGTRLINWDPTAKTTVSDAELEYVERDGTLWRIRYPFDKDDPDRGIEIATTRPETMLADVAIAVHPNDERYAALIGRSVWLPPLFDRSIPIVADEAVDPEFGTGAVKVTPAHDPTDYEIGVRHSLEMPSVIGLDARITGADRSVGPYLGLDRYEARERIVADLQKAVCCSKPGHTGIPLLPASAAATPSSRCSRCNGSFAWHRSQSRRSMPTATDACASFPNATAAPTNTGLRTFAIGTSRDRSGGDTSFPSGTPPTATRSSPKVKKKRERSRSAPMAQAC